jgi:hypothetical protein
MQSNIVHSLYVIFQCTTLDRMQCNAKAKMLHKAHRNELILVCFAVQQACNVILNAPSIVCAMHCNRTNVMSSLHTIMHYNALHYKLALI